MSVSFPNPKAVRFDQSLLVAVGVDGLAGFLLLLVNDGLLIVSDALLCPTPKAIWS